MPNQIPDNNYIQSQPQQYNPQQYNAQQYNPQQYNPQQYNPNMSPIQPNNLMTTAHFEILKNKIDTVQFELIDLLRHVKDYTQRYMTSVRQKDLAEIDEYIKGLFDVDKKIKETTEKAEIAEESIEDKEEIPTEQSGARRT